MGIDLCVKNTTDAYVWRKFVDKKYMEILLMMSMGFYYTGVVLQIYIPTSVRLCLVNMQFRKKNWHLKHFRLNWGPF